MAYIIATDSGCDIAPATLQKWGVISADLTFRFDGEDQEYTNREMSPKDFYDKMRAGGLSRTSAINSEIFKDLFRPVLEAGNDILYIGFDSGISTTSEQGIAAANELSEEYPDRRIIAIDTLCASGGQGLLVWLTVNKKNEGADLDDAAAFVRNLCPSIATWFTVDDLVYLKRGGRVSAAAAFAGNLLNIRPVLHVDDEGKLNNMFKMRGRKASLASLADQYVRLGSSVGSDGKVTGTQADGVPYVINHADAADDAALVEQMIFEKTGRKAEFIEDVGPVIGSHTGPGIIVLSFSATAR
jgi:DegV family protein with EDD domain